MIVHKKKITKSQKNKIKKNCSTLCCFPKKKELACKYYLDSINKELSKQVRLNNQNTKPEIGLFTRSAIKTANILGMNKKENNEKKDKKKKKFRFCAIQGELSSGWLTSIPNHVHSLTSSEFETIKLRLGCNMHKDQFTCDFCGGNRAVDQRGLHGLLCRGGGDRISRHNAIRDLLADLCSRASFSVEKVVVEKKHLLDESGERPADVFYSFIEWGSRIVS